MVNLYLKRLPITVIEQSIKYTKINWFRNEKNPLKSKTLQLRFIKNKTKICIGVSCKKEDKITTNQ